MVGMSALLGSFAMGIMFNSGNVPADLKMNGQYYAFKLLGEYYGVGNALSGRSCVDTNIMWPVYSFYTLVESKERLYLIQINDVETFIAFLSVKQ